MNKEQVIAKRSIIIFMLNLICFTILLLRFGYLQVIKTDSLSRVAIRNRTKQVVQPGLRGRMLDIAGNVIAEDEASYFIFAKKSYRKEIQNIRDEVRRLSLKDDLSLGSRGYIDTSRGYFLIGAHFSKKEVAKLFSDITLMEKIEIERMSKRHYLYKDITSNITGYVSLSDDKSRGFAGRSGIEMQYNEEMTGVPSITSSEFDAKGNMIKVIDAPENISGSDIKLSIDIRLQKEIKKYFADKIGSAVVIRVADGSVASLVTSPGYDPNSFTTGFKDEIWKSLISHYDKPMIDRSISVMYPPGSVFKLVTALALLKKGVVASEEIECNGQHKIGNRVFRCARRSGHGMVDFRRALSCSCNVYFYKMAEKLHIEDIHQVAKDIGIVSQTGIDLPFEAPGLIPNEEWKLRNIGERWRVGDTINSSIGQGYVLMTNLQIALLSSVIAGSKKVKPAVKLGISEVTEDDSLNDEHLAIVREAMAESFISDCGTCRRNRYFFERFGLVGKTGSAQTSTSGLLEEDRKGHSIFAGFFPYNEPEYAISIVVEKGGWGSGAALSIASYIARYLSLRH